MMVSSGKTVVKVTGDKRVIALVLTMVVAALPYRYRPGGKVQIVSQQEFRVQADEAGKVAYIIGQDNKNLPVRKGSVIAKLHSDEIESSLETNKKQIEAEKSKREVIEKDIASSNAQLTTYSDQVAISNRRLERWDSLYAKGAVSLEALDDVRRQNKTDRGNRNTQEELVRKAKEQLGVSEAEIGRLEKEQELVRIRQKNLSILMPFDGYISDQRLNRKKGLQLNTGDTLVTVRSLDKTLYGRVQVTESEATNIRIGAKVEIRLKRDWGQALFGRVVEIGRIAEVSDNASSINTTTDSGQEVKNRSEQAGRVVNVIIMIRDVKNEKIIPGMTGQAKVDGRWMPLGQVFLRSVIRYLNVEVWSWLP